ncbi:triphosphoribosyl-dephospho-CoA synthase [Streptomyces sp. NPDC058401]|uniref:triphosphoribosyl-dephospho-CoA synthase n=1 Tax=Streptomyces sp. NPDC058401 TaxID=3346480 RepID=UPI003656ABDD
MTPPLSPAPLRAPAHVLTDRLSDRLAGLASDALAAEAELTPKPGLVDGRGSGAHHDMDLGLLLKSAATLRGSFAEMASAGARIGRPTAELRSELARIGRRAEARMLTATGGVNTHRGAIWALGLLTGAAALASAPEGDAPSLAYAPSFTDALCATAGTIAAHPDPSAPVTGPSNGQLAGVRYGGGGARAEAVAGFPHVRRALDALRRSRAAGADETSARLDALLTVIGSLDDTCLLHRGGPTGLAAAQEGARAVLAAGGCASRPGRAALLRLDARMTGLGLSPGGSADLLAAALYADALSGALSGAGSTTGSTILPRS